QHQEIEIVHHRQLSLAEVLAVSSGKAQVRLSDETASMLDERRQQVVAFIKELDEPAYGFNRGFGHNVKEPVDPSRAKALQTNLIPSHACGVGPPAPLEIVRGAMFLRAYSLARGHSSVRSVVVKTLIECLNKGVTPVVPRLGSVSASG